MSKAIHILRVVAQNIGRLKFVEVEVDEGGRLVMVIGDNKAGKSSLMHAIEMTLGGAKKQLPGIVNDEVEGSSGQVELTMTNGFTVKCFVSDTGARRLTVVGPDGGKYGQAILNEWLGGNHDFDIQNFFNLKEARQVEILFGLSKDAGLSSKVKSLNSEIDVLYAKRTPHLSEQTRLRKVQEPEGERPEAVDVSAEMKDLEALEEKHAERERLASDVGDSDLKLADIASEQEIQRRAIKSVEAELVQIRAGLAALVKEHEEEFDKRGEEQDRLDSAPSVHEEITAVRSRITLADQTNEALRPWKEYDRAQEGLEVETAKADELTAKIKDARDHVQRTIAGAEIPVPGLSFDPEATKPLLEGRPFALASGGQKITMALDVAVAKDPDLKIVLIDEANNLGAKLLKETAEAAKERDLQVWCCRLDGEADVVVEDGEARSA